MATMDCSRELMARVSAVALSACCCAMHWSWEARICIPSCCDTIIAISACSRPECDALADPRAAPAGLHSAGYPLAGFDPMLGWLPRPRLDIL